MFATLARPLPSMIHRKHLGERRNGGAWGCTVGRHPKPLGRLAREATPPLAASAAIGALVIFIFDTFRVNQGLTTRNEKLSYPKSPTSARATLRTHLPIGCVLPLVVRSRTGKNDARAKNCRAPNTRMFTTIKQTRGRGGFVFGANVHVKGRGGHDTHDCSFFSIKTPHNIYLAHYLHTARFLPLRVFGFRIWPRGGFPKINKSGGP